MNSADNLALLGRVMGGLIVVLVLIGLAARVARRARGNTGASGLRVLDRVGLSREANLAVIEVGNRVLLLGVTAQGVTMLADLDELSGSIAREPDGFAPENDGFTPDPDETEFEAELAREADLGIDLSERGFAIDPEFVDVPEPSSHRPVPTGIALDQYPDLASALRAAGRTTESTAGPDDGRADPARPGPAGSALAVSAATRPTPGGSRPVPVPRTRAQARAEARSLTRPVDGSPTAGPESVPAARSRMSLRRRSSRSAKPKIVAPSPSVPASGSVLSPQTWRQGVEALRDLTVRRG